MAPGTYRYRVRATDAAGNLGPYSNIVNASIQGGDTTPPSAPTGLAATAQGSSGISLSWLASTDNVAVTGYLLSRCQGVGCTNFTQIGSALVGTTFVDSGLSPSTSYTYRVLATDAANNQGPSSSSATATTLAGPGGVAGDRVGPTCRKGCWHRHVDDARVFRRQQRRQLDCGGRARVAFRADS